MSGGMVDGVVGCICLHEIDRIYDRIYDRIIGNFSALDARVLN